MGCASFHGSSAGIYMLLTTHVSNLELSLLAKTTAVSITQQIRRYKNLECNFSKDSLSYHLHYAPRILIKKNSFQQDICMVREHASDSEFHHQGGLADSA